MTGVPVAARTCQTSSWYVALYFCEKMLLQLSPQFGVRV